MLHLKPPRLNPEQSDRQVSESVSGMLADIRRRGESPGSTSNDQNGLQ